MQGGGRCVSLANTHLLNIQISMPVDFSLTAVDLSNAETRIVVGLQVVFTSYFIVGAYNKQNDVRYAQVLGESFYRTIILYCKLE